jgi:hypothetical protein
LLIGNNPYATGTWSVKKGFDNWYEERALEYGISDISKLDEVQKNSLNRKIAVDYMIKNPWETIKITVKKAHMFLIYPATHTDDNIPIQLTAVILEFLLWIGVAVGITAIPKFNRNVILVIAAILFFSLIQMILHAEARYRLPLVPLLCLYFGWGAYVLTNKQEIKTVYSSKRKLNTVTILIGTLILVYAYTGILFFKGSI